jgi:hypothetical protein
VAPAQAEVIGYEFRGSVSSQAFYMGTGYTNPLFEVGDDFYARIVFDDAQPAGSAIRSLNYQIDNLAQGGGRTFAFSMSDFTGWTTSVSDQPDNFFAYGLWTALSPRQNNWALAFDGNQIFSHNSFAPAGSEEAFSYNFNATLTEMNAVPIPGAAWLLGSGLIGLVGFRRKHRKVS